MSSNDSGTSSRRRTVLKALGVVGTSLFTAAGSAAAKPGKGPKNKEKRSGRGRGRWCRSEGEHPGRGNSRGRGYQRNIPHSEHPTRWDDHPGNPGRGDDEDDEDSDDDDQEGGEDPSEDPEPTPEDPEDGDDDADDGSEDDDGGEMVEFETTIRVVDQNGDPVEGELVESRRLAENEWSELGTTDENGEVVLTGQSSDPSDAMMFDVRVRDTVVPVSLDNTDSTETIEIGTDDSSPDEPESVAAQIESRIHSEVNEYREENDLDPLEQSDDLAAVAREHSADMAEQDYFSHTSPDGNGPGDRLEAAGIDCSGWAENLAYETDSEFSADDAQSVADSIVQGWIDSDGHRQNLLGDFEEEGIGVDVRNNTVTATQMFCSGR